MRVTKGLFLAVAPLAVAAPTPSLFGDILALEAGIAKVVTTVVSTVKSDIQVAVSKIGATLQTDASKHGSVWNYGNIPCPEVALSIQRYLHDIAWTKKSTNYVDWTTYKANGINFGAWLEQEQNYDPDWWNAHAPDAIDEWAYARLWLAAQNINTLRIPTTYAAWIKFPGSKLYHGNQQTYLRNIALYAIQKYGMHVIIGLHSLPGGVNSLGIGEAFGHSGWFQNATNLDYSFKAIDAILTFIQSSGQPQGFTIAPINEASDNFEAFASSEGLTANGTNWINTYINGVLTRTFWSPFYAAGTNLVIDSHIYFFAAAGIYSQYVSPAICGQAEYTAGDSKFPVFIGEWSLQTLYNNTLAGRKVIHDTQVYAYQKYVSGSAFWNVKMINNTAAVDGEGITSDYWSWELLVDQGVITPTINGSYC
ncbi:putative exo-beta-1,3-glucanase [Botrytis cinerea]